MTAIINEERFGLELSGWLLRGVLCAASSAGWAVVLGFQAPAEIAGMFAGVALWVVVFAGLCASAPPRMRWWNHAEVVTSLKWGASIKIGLTVVGWTVFAAGNFLRVDELSQIAVIGMLDLVLGVTALAVVAFVAGLKGPEVVAATDSFGLTVLATVVEGALVAGVMVALAVGVWTVWRVSKRFGIPARVFPARDTG